jgi:tight adherence protein B
VTGALLAAALVLALGTALQPRPRARSLVAADAPAAHRRGRRPARARWPGRRHRVEPLELAAWCDALSRAVRGGATLRHALCTVTPPGPAVAELDRVLLALDRGATTVDALDSVEHAPPHLDLVLVVLRACARHGGAPAEPIDRAAAALRQRAALIAERASQSAQARMSAGVMTLLPGALLAVLVATSSPVRHTIATPAGVVAIALGAAANGTGWWWMRRLIRGRAGWP